MNYELSIKPYLTMASLTFYLRSSSRVGIHPGMLCFRIIHARRVLSQSTGFRLYPREWDSQGRRVVYPPEDEVRIAALKTVELQQQIIQASFARIISVLEDSGRYRVEDVMSGFRFGHDSDSLADFSRQQSFLLTRSGRERTARAYLTAVRGLIAFNSGQDVPLKHLNGCLVKDFEKDMKQRGKSLNTISFYMRNLRALYNKAIACGRIAASGAHPFSDVYTGVEKTRKRSLSMSQLKALNDLDLSRLLSTYPGQERLSERKQEVCRGLDSARRLFLFCFHARGMSFVDMAYLRKENIQGNRIRYYRKKTGGMLELKITPAMQEIIDSFRFETRHSAYIFPVLCARDKPLRLQYESGLRLQNSRLKRLALLAGIDRPVSTHVSRHSWASTAKNENLPLWVISEGLGHSSERMTYTYLSSLDCQVLDQASELITKALSGPPLYHYRPARG